MIDEARRNEGIGDFYMTPEYGRTARFNTLRNRYEIAAYTTPRYITNALNATGRRWDAPVSRATYMGLRTARGGGR